MVCDGCEEAFYLDPMATDEIVCLECPDNAYCAGMTLLPVPRIGYWSNRSNLELVHHIHSCPRGVEVCPGGLNESASDKQAEVVLFEECWLPENLAADACKDDILW